MTSWACRRVQAKAVRELQEERAAAQARESGLEAQLASARVAAEGVGAAALQLEEKVRPSAVSWLGRACLGSVHGGLRTSAEQLRG